MSREERTGPDRDPGDSAGPPVEQELVIRPDGRIEVPWITPKASRLVREVFDAVSDGTFPVGVVSGNIYCG